jgi:hypothetical protein
VNSQVCALAVIAAIINPIVRLSNFFMFIGFYVSAVKHVSAKIMVYKQKIFF